MLVFCRNRDAAEALVIHVVYRHHTPCLAAYRPRSNETHYVLAVGNPMRDSAGQAIRNPEYIEVAEVICQFISKNADYPLDMDFDGTARYAVCICAQCVVAEQYDGWITEQISP